MVKGIEEKLASKIVESAMTMSRPPESSRGLENWLAGEEDGLSEWLSGDERPGPVATVANPEVSSNDSLARWLSGKEDDVNVWLQEAPTTGQATDAIGPHELLAREAEVIQLRETLKEKLREFESGDFSPQRVVDELARAVGTRAQPGHPG